MADFLKAYEPVRQYEGGWCDVPGDAGGETYAGIARNFFPDWPGWKVIDEARQHVSFRSGARAFSKHLDSIPGLADMVTDWYRAEWWEPMHLARFPQSVADEIFEQSVNLGRAGAGRYLQRLCNALNYDKRTDARLFPDLMEDGAVGPKTLAALAALLEQRASDTAIVHALNGLQAAHYIGLGAKNFAHRKFMDGWLSRTHCPESRRQNGGESQ